MNQRRRCLQAGALGLSLGALGLPLGTALAANSQLLALVIGNDHYQQNARLNNAGKDAELVGSVLQDMGATVIRLRDATANQMRQQVADLAKRAAAQNAVAWLYYSGHGVQVNGRNYLQGVDADFSLPERVRSQGLDLNWVSEILSRDRLPAAVVLIDACRDNPFLPASRGLDGQGLAPIEPQGQLVGFSTAPFKKALDGRQQANGPYATALANVLKKRPVALHAALQQVAQQVYLATGKQQVPWFSSSLRAELLLDQHGVRLGTSAISGGGTALGGSADRTRSAFSYRPDLPDAEPAARGFQYWSALETRLMARVQNATADEANQWMNAATKPDANEDVRLLAGMVVAVGKAGVKVDKAAALRLFLPIARSGNAVAQTLLGETYYELRNLSEAFRWLSIAAESGLTRPVMALTELNIRMDLLKAGSPLEMPKSLNRIPVDTIGDIQKE